MPYKHAGEIGDVWKHLPLCDILKIERPIRYRESNSAYSGYTISANPRTEYGIFKMMKLNKPDFISSAYYQTLKKNGIDDSRYTGSPALAMDILLDKAQYYFHDLEQEALDDVEGFALRSGLSENVETFCGDSICAFMNKDYVLDKNDFVFLDPYTPFAISDTIDFNFFDIFKKVVTAKSKTLMWYGYDNLNEQHAISEQLEKIAMENKIEIYSFDVWIKSMNTHGCDINPGVPGCGLACANLSVESVDVLRKYLALVEACYSDAMYCESEAGLVVRVGEYL